VAIATLGSTLVAYLLWGFVRFSAMSMHDMFGDVALPMFTGKLIQNRILFWALPTLSLITGVVLLAKRKHSSPNLLIYVSSFVFASVVAVTFTIVALAIPWMRLIGNKIGS
jgi:hypothetical protein